MVHPKLFMKWENPGTALITGASAGLGMEFAEQLAQKGFNLIIVARRQEKLDELATKFQHQYSIQVRVVCADLTLEEGIGKVVKIINEDANVEILVNNAGFGNIGDFARSDLSKALKMNALHVITPIHLTHAALQGMLERRRGAVINVSSISSFLRSKGGVMYSSTKIFIRNFAETLQKQLKNSGIRFQALCPGYITTEFHEVGDFKGFDRQRIPKTLWMTCQEVVTTSLKDLEKGKIVCVPGWKYKIIRTLVCTPGIGSMIRKFL
jgi:uncharacterized protein